MILCKSSMNQIFFLLLASKIVVHRWSVRGISNVKRKRIEYQSKDRETNQIMPIYENILMFRYCANSIVQYDTSLQICNARGIQVGRHDYLYFYIWVLCKKLPVGRYLHFSVADYFLLDQNKKEVISLGTYAYLQISSNIGKYLPTYILSLVLIIQAETKNTYS